MAEQQYEVGCCDHAITIEIVSDVCFRNGLHKKRKEIEEVTERHDEMCCLPIDCETAFCLDENKYNKDEKHNQWFKIHIP